MMSNIFNAIKNGLVEKAQKKSKRNSLPDLLKQTDNHDAIIINEMLSSLLQKARFLLQDSRHTQLTQLAKDHVRREISPVEKAANRDLVTALASWGMIIAGNLVYAPLWYIGTGFVLYLMSKIAYYACKTLIQERRVNTSLIDLFLSTGIVIGGYWGVAAFGMALFSLSKKLVARTEDIAHKKLVNIFNTQALFVWTIIDDIEIEVPFEQIKTGDIVVVYAGQLVPVDGVITDGVASIDQHMLTGESQLVEKTVGDRVMASTIVITGRLQVQVEQAGEETLAAQIGDILNNTLDFKQQITSKSEMIANRSVLPTFTIGIVALMAGGLNSALAILESSAGFNLRMTGPISMLNFLQIASQENILIKDGRSLELLAQVDTIVFDKTGTLTLDELSVRSIFNFGDFTETQVLTYAAIAEYRQSHPVAKAILAEADNNGLRLPKAENLHYEVGYGIRVTFSNQAEDQVILVGSDRYMTLENVEIPQAVSTLQRASQAQGHSLVMVAVDGRLVGAIELQPIVRDEAKAVIDDLRQRNLNLYIISGDQEEPTRNLAERLGIENYFANTLPEEKAKLVEQLQAEGKSVCFIGDGINDAIALKKANVSVSLCGATTVATDVAQVVFMDGRLEKLSLLLALSQEFEKKMKTNVFLSIAPAVFCGIGVFFFQFGLLASFIIYDIGVIAGIINGSLPLLKDYTQITAKTRKQLHD